MRNGNIVVDEDAKLEEELIIARHQKPSSGIPIKAGYNPTATCRSWLTSGPM